MQCMSSRAARIWVKRFQAAESRFHDTVFLVIPGGYTHSPEGSNNVIGVTLLPAVRRIPRNRSQSPGNEPLRNGTNRQKERHFRFPMSFGWSCRRRATRKSWRRLGEALGSTASSFRQRVAESSVCCSTWSRRRRSADTRESRRWEKLMQNWNVVCSDVAAAAVTVSA